MLVQDSLLAYIDILGFESAIKTYEKNEDHLMENGIINCLNNLSLVKAGFGDHIHKISVFSDTIVASDTEITFEKLRWLIMTTQMIQKDILLCGYLTRGIILKGNLFHLPTDNIIFGSALINAYHIERDLKMPFVQVSSNLLEEFDINTADKKQMCDYGLDIDEDCNDNKTFHVDYLDSHLLRLANATPSATSMAIDFPSYVNNEHQKLTNYATLAKMNLTKYDGNESIKAKWTWLSTRVETRLNAINSYLEKLKQKSC